MCGGNERNRWGWRGRRRRTCTYIRHMQTSSLSLQDCVYRGRLPRRLVEPLHLQLQRGPVISLPLVIALFQFSSVISRNNARSIWRGCGSILTFGREEKRRVDWRLHVRLGEGEATYGCSKALRQERRTLELRLIPAHLSVLPSLSHAMSNLPTEGHCAIYRTSITAKYANQIITGNEEGRQQVMRPSILGARCGK